MLRSAIVALLALTLAAPGARGLEPLPAAGRARSLEALWYREGETGKPRLFGVTKIRATVMPNPEQEVRVGVFEEYAGATGAQWRSSIWIASFIASVVLGRDLTENRFDISTGGYIDGPSAGALMAVGFLAALTGDEVLPDATLTGALAPDGTVSPVGGIPEKIEAAKATQKRVVGIPAGQSTATGADGKAVDVVQFGRSLGVEVREVGDIYDAYALLTGKTLSHPTPVEAAKMEVPPSIYGKLRARAEAMHKQAAEDLKLLRGDKTPGLRRALATARLEQRSVARFLAQGDNAAAYHRALRAAAMARAAVRVAGFTGGEKFARSSGSLDETDAEIQRVERELEALSRDVKSKPLLLFAGYSAVTRARGFLELARAMLASAVASLGKRRSGVEVLRAIQKSGQAFLPALYLTFADLAIDFGRDLLRNPGEFETPLKFDDSRLARASRGFVSAASGNMEYIDALLLTDLARERKLSLDVIRNAFGQNERAYLLASQLAQFAIIKTVDRAPLTTAASLIRLQAAANSYVESASVITKYYSLEAQVVAEDKTADVRRTRALDALLHRAEVNAREAAAIAQARLGIIPPDAQFYYSAGVKELAYGTARAKLRALRDFWRSSVASRAAAMVMQKPPASPPQPE